MKDFVLKQSYLQGGGLLFSLLGAGLAFGLYLTPDNGKNRSSRLAMLLGFAFLTGLGLGPLLQVTRLISTVTFEM